MTNSTNPYLTAKASARKLTYIIVDNVFHLHIMQQLRNTCMTFTISHMMKPGMQF